MSTKNRKCESNETDTYKFIYIYFKVSYFIVHSEIIIMQYYRQAYFYENVLPCNINLITLGLLQYIGYCLK